MPCSEQGRKTHLHPLVATETSLSGKILGQKCRARGDGPCPTGDTGEAEVESRQEVLCPGGVRLVFILIILTCRGITPR